MFLWKSLEKKRTAFSRYMCWASRVNVGIGKQNNPETLGLHKSALQMSKCSKYCTEIHKYWTFSRSKCAFLIQNGCKQPLQFWAGVQPEESCHGTAPCLYPTTVGLLRIRSLSLLTGFHRASALMGEITGNNLYFARTSVRISKPNNPF